MKFFAEFNVQAVVTVTMILFAVIDIIGSIPLIIQIKQKAGEIHPLKATFVALGIMVLFLFLGEQILSLIGISVESFAVAGAFILFAMAVEMILGVTLFKEEGPPKTASIVPLAFPIIAGAGTMTSLLSLRAEFATINILIGIAINMILVWVTLALTARIEKLLGAGGIAVIRKVFGIILLAIAVKLFSSNAKILLS
jgi:multiple antibiotic resistance protein